MNKILKWILIALNLLILIIAFRWFQRDDSEEPTIAFISSCATLLGLLLEGQISNVRTSDVTGGSKVKIRTKNLGNVSTKRIDDSDIDIQT